MSSTKSRIRLIGAFGALAALALAVSCRGFFVSPTVTSITIGPTGVNLAPGANLQMTAMGAMSDNSPAKNVTTQCFWSIDNASAATIGQNSGYVTAATTIANPPQTVNVTAVYQALPSAKATITVCPNVSTLTITATPVTVSAGQAVQVTFTALATFAGVSGSQNVVDQVTWNISNTNVLPSISNGVGTTTTNTVSGDSTQVTATLCNFTSQPVTISVQ